jgi:hypothetical protein
MRSIDEFFDYISIKQRLNIDAFFDYFWMDMREETESNGTIIIKNELGLAHSYNGEPAIITCDGYKVWYDNGKKHRVGNPAVVKESFPKCYEWWHNGYCHREDGAAITIITEEKSLLYFFINGKQMSINEWVNVCSLSEEEKLEFLLRWG